MAHRNRAPVDALVAEGAREVKSPREMAAAADIIVICVTGSPEVEAVVRGENGILAGAKPGLLVINSSTADPVSTATLAAGAAGGRRQPRRRAALAHAEGGGGRHARLHGRRLGRRISPGRSRSSNASPPRSCMSARSGAGHTMKLINNFVSISYAAIYSEALSLGARVGISPKQFHAVIGGGRMSCGFYDTFMKYVVERDRDAHKFTHAERPQGPSLPGRPGQQDGRA